MDHRPSRRGRRTTGGPTGPGGRRSTRSSRSSTRSGIGRSRSRSELDRRTGPRPRRRGPARRRADRAGAGARGRCRTEHRRPAAAPAHVPRPMPGICWSPTLARRASTWRSPTSTAASSPTATSRPTSPTARRRAWRGSTSCSTSCARRPATCPGALWGVGIGVPGPVEFRTGPPISPPIMPGWDGYPVRERFAARYGAPVWVDNDVNLLALGEWRSGIAAGHDNVVVVKIGTGIGAGIISERPAPSRRAGQRRRRRPHPGRRRRVGRLPLRQRRLPRGARRRRGARPGRRGGGTRRAAASGCGSRSTSTARVTAEDVARAASFGDPVAVAMLQAAGRRVGLMLASDRELLQPVADRRRRRRGAERRPAAGRDPRDGLPPLAAAGDARACSSSARRSAALAGVIGASAMVVDQLFSRDSIGSLDAGRRAVRRSPDGVARRRGRGAARSALGDHEVDEVAGRRILQDQLVRGRRAGSRA